MNIKIFGIAAVIAATLALAACDPSKPGTGASVTPADIVAGIANTCKFKTTIQAVQAVVVQQVGPSGVLTNAVASQIEDAICAAVQVQLAQQQSAPAPQVAGKLAREITVTVNGVQIKGVVTQ